MIKLMPIVEQIQQEQLEEAGVKDIALGAAMAASSLFGGAKAQSKIPTDKPAITIAKDTASERTGTDVDGINGFFTSQFRFPKAFLKNLNSGKISDLGHDGNVALQKVNEAGITVKQMAEWNNFGKWMDEKGVSGNKKMDHVEFSQDILDQYKEINPTFWVTDSNDIKKVQTVIKAYRLYTISVWKLGVDGALKAGFEPVGIKLGEQEMEPTIPEDVKQVEKRYMAWAK